MVSSIYMYITRSKSMSLSRVLSHHELFTIVIEIKTCQLQRLPPSPRQSRIAFRHHEISNVPAIRIWNSGDEKWLHNAGAHQLPCMGDPIDHLLPAGSWEVLWVRRSTLCLFGLIKRVMLPECWFSETSKSYRQGWQLCGLLVSVNRKFNYHADVLWSCQCSILTFM